MVRLESRTLTVSKEFVNSDNFSGDEIFVKF